jgi:hypothetical protein
MLFFEQRQDRSREWLRYWARLGGIVGMMGERARVTRLGEKAYIALPLTLSGAAQDDGGRRPCVVLDELIDDCDTCRRACLETFAHCLEVGGTHIEGDHVQCLIDCAEICALCTSFLGRGSDAFESICAICVDFCERCARECESFGDGQMARCAAACRACADRCRQHLLFLAA